MSVIHGAWLPDRRRFLWWSESPQALDPEMLKALQGPRGGRNGPAWYDHITAPDPVLKELEGQLNQRLQEYQQEQKLVNQLKQERISSESIHAILHLPTDEQGRVAGNFSPDVVPDRLTPCTVPGLATVPLSTLKALVALPQGKPIRGQTPGDDLLLWQMAAQFVRDLLAQGEYLPGLSEGRAAWVPALDYPEHARRLDALVNAMPAACRAGAARAGRLPDGEELLRDFIGVLLDTSVNALDNTSLGALGASSPWLTSLFADRQDGRTSVWLASPEFQSAWQDWTKHVHGESAGSQARTCLRLDAPETGEVTDKGIYQGHGWRLSFHLQAVQDESLLVPAREVWETRSRTLRRMDLRFEAPQERLLSDLARAARLFEPIQRALQESRPEFVDLEPSEVRELVAGHSQALRDEGFGLLLPSWDKVQSQVGGGVKLHLRLKPTGPSAGRGAGAGPEKSLVGLEQLCDFNWEVSLGGLDIPVDEFKRLVKLKVPVVEHRGQWLVFDPEAAQKTLDFLDSSQSSGQASLGTLMRHSLGLEPDGLLGGTAEGEGAAKAPVAVGETRAEDWLAGVFERLQSGGQAGQAPVSGNFVGKLRPYQSQGLSWLRFLDQFGLGGCLADDMGLGKTVQLLALLADDIDRAVSGEEIGPTLLVCPTSVMGNWQREARRFVPRLRVRLHHGPQRLDGEAFSRDAKRMHLVIVSYGLADRDLEDLMQVKWRRVILDEAQNIKNPSTRQHQAVKKIPSESRFALTGTPVENRLSELWSVYDFLIPGHLGTAAQFGRRFSRPIQQEKDEHAANMLKRLTGPFLLRRVKTDPQVAGDLPEKQENKVFCALTREQATLYQAVVDRMALETAQEGESARSGIVLNTLLRLKQVCNHPTLFLADGSELGDRSGKLQRLGEMLEEVLEEGQKALVFTQFKEMGDLIRKYLEKHLDIEVPFLHGGVERSARDEMVDRFQTGGADGPPVLLLSLKAGGTGLNLTAASHVFHFDRWWNPAVEDQATDRAFRIGQKRNVLVHKFVCQGTVEELIDQMILSKKDLADRIVGHGTELFTELSVQELREAFSLREDAVEEDDG
jgi:SNF2 family DNA or RNA helicase